MIGGLKYVIGGIICAVVGSIFDKKIDVPEFVPCLWYFASTVNGIAALIIALNLLDF